MKMGGNCFKTGLLMGIITFVALSLVTNGLIEFSRDVGVLAWLGETAAYAITNKLAEKLVASFAIAGVSSFVAHMIAYGKIVKTRRGTTTHVRFGHGDTNSTRTA